MAMNALTVGVTTAHHMLQLNIGTVWDVPLASDWHSGRPGLFGRWPGVSSWSERSVCSPRLLLPRCGSRKSDLACSATSRVENPHTGIYYWLSPELPKEGVSPPSRVLSGGSAILPVRFGNTHCSGQQGSFPSTLIKPYSV